MSACLAMSGTFAAIFSFEASKKWIIRDGGNGISRDRVGAPIARGLKKSRGLLMDPAAKDILLASEPIRESSESMAVAPELLDRTDEQRAITEMVRQFVDKQIIPNAEHYDHEDEFPEPIVEQMKELGLFGVTIPEEYGGMGLDLTTYAMIVEELSRGWISISGVVNTHFIGSYLLMKFGTDEQKEHFLPKMATGELRAAFSLSEPEVGSDVQGIKSTATKDGDAWVLNGQKMWVTNGLLSGVVFVLMKNDTKADPPYKGMTCFITEKEPGAARTPVTTRPRDSAQDQEDGLQGRRVHGARLRRLPLPARPHPRRRGGGARPGLPPDDGRARGRARERGGARGRHRPARARAGAALLAGAQDLRQADRAAPGDPVQARRHGDEGRGRAPFDLQGRAHEGRRAALRRRGRHGEAVRVGGRQGGRRGLFRIHGGYGYSKEYEIERLYRDAPLLLIGEGTSEIQRMVIGKKLLESHKI